MRTALLAALGLCLAAAAQAAVVTDITVNPLTGSAAIPGDGIRTVVNSGLTLDAFATGAGGDRFRFQLAPFGLDGGLDFVNSTVDLLPSSGVNLIVLQNATNPSTGAGLNAGAAANLIAGALTEDGAGFFVYFNASLGINRLVFSENLNATTADLAILAAISNPTGAAAVAELAGFSNVNFAAISEPAVAPVPLPATALLLCGALAGLAALRRRG